MEVQTTTLTLLTREGAVTISLTPALQANQYDELLQLVNAPESRQELSELVQGLAARWQRTVTIDFC
jgi:hypothetical protein